ncbi:xyn11C [Poronia punctata]|nr:xyn11C [Poronia punctata]
MLSSLVLALLPGVALALPQLGERFHGEDSNSKLEARQGYYWSNWSEGSGNWQCADTGGGSYSVQWSGSDGGFVCGKGWNYGGGRSVTYSGEYEATGPGYLSVYGWTTNPLVEYYIVESHADLAPNEPWTFKGNFTSDDSVYSVYTSTRVNKPSIIGTATFEQYWSIREDQRVGGTVTVRNHFDYWNSLGMGLGQDNYMILATEGYTSGSNGPSGHSSITVQ